MTEARLLSLVAPQLRTALQKGSVPAAIGIHSETRWQGPVEITLDSVRLLVAQCDSVLAAREQLAARGSDWLAIVTPLELTDLGADVEARLLRHRLFRLEPWDLLRMRFNARTFDGSLLGKAALAEAAVEALGATNPDPAPAGVLTAESVWRVVIENRLGVDEARPDARKWLEWAQEIAAGARWRALGDDLKGLLVDWIAGYLGDWAITFAGCLDAGYGQQAMALGLALGVVRQARQDAQERVILAQASGRLEQYSGGRKISVQAQRVWNEGAEQWATNHAAAGDISTVLVELGEADRILEKTGALPLAWLSKWSVTGFAERLERFSAIDLEIEPLEFEARLRDVESHELARWSTRERSWTERARMAARLARWLETSLNSTKDWAESVSSYVDHGAWVDWARQALTAGDEPEGTAQRWAALCERAARRRNEESLRFGRHLAEVVRQDSFGEAVIPVERLLERVVAPWGKDRVLLILMDGMSFAVWHELCEELVQTGAQLWSWREDRALPPGLSVLPSMTKHSRVSLLCGKLSSGGQDIEKRGFSENPALVAASRSSYPPVLFHKDELAGEAVRKEIRNSQRRVIGVVINVVDDSLDGPDQRTFHWSLGQVPVLRALLTEADTAGRTVIFASDHGHTLERATVLRRVGATDRYHAPEEDAVGSDEVLLTGRRVLEPGGSVIALATEGVRYTASRKMGYHGGATPQECLAPVAVISSAAKGPDGWVKTAENAPLWWYAGGATPAEPAPKPKARPAQPLFEGVAGIDRDWIRDLLDASVFAEQMRNVGGRLDVARTEQALRGLAMRNGVLMKPALAQRIDLPPFRIDGFLSNFERVLNVDGYPVLSVDDSDTVRLDIDLLKKQFGLE